MSLDTLRAEARTKIAARDEARKALEALQAEIETVTSAQPGAFDAANEAKRVWETALAGNGNVTTARSALCTAKERLEMLEATEAGLQRRIEALEKDHAQKRSAAAVVVVRIATLRATELAEETRRLARVTAANHARWHRIARGAAAIASEASGRHEEPIAAQDPGASCLRGHRGRFDEGLEEDFRAAGLNTGGGIWWAPGNGLAGMNETEILAEAEPK